MTDLPVLARRLLALLEARAPAARDAADLGDPAPLDDLLEDALRDADAGVLADPGAERDLAGDDLPLADALRTWRGAALPAEARWRASAGAAVVTLGSLQVNLSELEALGAHEDQDRRTAAWACFEAEWGPRVRSLGGWLHRPEAPVRAAPAPATEGGLVLPGPDLVSIFSAPGHFDPALLTAPASGPLPAPGVWAGQAELEALAGELAATFGPRPRSFGAWRRAAESAVADSRPRDPDPRRTRFAPPHPLVPAARGGRAALASGPSGRAWVIRALAGSGRPFPALLSRVGGWFVRAHVSDPGGDPLRSVRGLALAVAAVGLEAQWAVSADGDPARLDLDLTRFGAADAPATWRTLAVRSPWAEARPGEGQSLYLHGARVIQGLADGAVQASALRDAFDEDWSTREVATAIDGPEGARDLTPLVRWLQEAARL